MMEYRELFLALFRKFDERYHPRSFLCDLVETTHLFLKMLERFCRSRGNLMVQVLGSSRLWEELWGGEGRGFLTYSTADSDLLGLFCTKGHRFTVLPVWS